MKVSIDSPEWERDALEVFGMYVKQYLGARAEDAALDLKLDMRGVLESRLRARNSGDEPCAVYQSVSFVRAADTKAFYAGELVKLLDRA